MFRTMLLTLCALGLAVAADVSGTWKFEVQTDQGSGSPTFTLKQDGEKLTGTYAGQLGTANIDGTVKGEKIEIRFKLEMQGQGLIVKYSGAIESPTRMKGTVDFSGMGSGTWTGTKQ